MAGKVFSAKEMGYTVYKGKGKDNLHMEKIEEIITLIFKLGIIIQTGLKLR